MALVYMKFISGILLSPYQSLSFLSDYLPFAYTTPDSFINPPTHANYTTIVVVQSLNLSEARQTFLPFTFFQSLFKLISIDLVMPSNRFNLCHPLILLPSIFTSIRIFSNESALCIRCPKYWSFNFRVSPSDEYSAFISFRVDRSGLLDV